MRKIHKGEVRQENTRNILIFLTDQENGQIILSSSSGTKLPTSTSKDQKIIGFCSLVSFCGP
jgi:hypothetical protein